LTKDTQSPLHVDALNVGPSAILGFGDFRGGELWVLGSGARRVGPEQPLRFDGTRPHCTLSFTGTRYTAIFYLNRCHEELAKGDGDYLQNLGFALPLELANCPLPTQHETATRSARRGNLVDARRGTF